MHVPIVILADSIARNLEHLLQIHGSQLAIKHVLCHRLHELMIFTLIQRIDIGLSELSLDIFLNRLHIIDGSGHPEFIMLMHRCRTNFLDYIDAPTLNAHLII